MGLFDIFKKQNPKETKSDSVAANNASLRNFDFYYLYGFTDKPNAVSQDSQKFGELYNLVIGSTGGLAINNSFHPYFIVNTKGTTVWIAAFFEIFQRDNKTKIFNDIETENAIFIVDTSTIFTEINVWPDTRLTYEKNPLFGKFVPFIIPFLVKKTHTQLNWDKEIGAGIKRQGHASDYVNKITEAIRFFMPKPAFIMGFDEFDENNPSKLIDNFINCKQMFGEE